MREDGYRSMHVMEGRIVDSVLTLSGDTVLSGQATGSVIVPGPFTLKLNGSVMGDLTVQENGSAIVHGLIAGTLVNCGGTVAVFGTVGSLRTEGGTTTVSPSAVITSAD